MIEIEMSKDIQEYEPALIGPFTARQIICVTIAVSYGIPLFMALNGMDIVARIMIVFFAMVPMGFFGWFKIYNLPLEIFLLLIIKNKIIRPQKRVYESGNIYELYPETPYYKKVKRSKNVKRYK